MVTAPPTSVDPFAAGDTNLELRARRRSRRRDAEFVLSCVCDRKKFRLIPSNPGLNNSDFSEPE